MNKRQAILKKMAKRTKARENKKEKPTKGASERYISKAERARLAAEGQASTDLTDIETSQPSPGDDSHGDSST